MPFEMLDIGIIMGSTSLTVFEDMVQKYPGASYFYGFFKDYCKCGDPECSRKMVQQNLQHLFNGDKDQCALFFQKLSGCEGEPSGVVIQTVLADMGLLVSTEPERKLVQDRIMEELEKILGMMSVDDIKLN